MEQFGSQWMDFHEMILEYFLKICPENSSLINITQKYRVLYMKTNINFASYLVHFFLE
jgi:hypothetical protein